MLLPGRGSDNERQLVPHGVVEIGFLLIGIAGVAFMRVPEGHAHGLWWLGPIGTAAFLVAGNLVAWAWRRTHRDPAQVSGA